LKFYTGGVLLCYFEEIDPWQLTPVVFFRQQIQ
jgi:hypothetical protein